MISSSELSALTASFLQSGGQIEKHDIIVRDFASTKTGFMLTSSVKEKPVSTKEKLKARKKRGHSFKQRNKALAVMAQHANLSVKEIVERAGVSENTVREAIKYSGYNVRMLASARPPVNKNNVIANANAGLTATQIAEKSGCTRAYVYRVCRAAGIAIKSERGGDYTELERAILSIKTRAYTAKQIAAQVGCTQPHVRVVCKKYNRKLKSGVKNYVKRASRNDSTNSDNA